MSQKEQNLKFSTTFFAVVMAAFFTFILFEVYINEISKGIVVETQNNIVVTPKVTRAPTPSPAPIVSNIKDGTVISSPLTVTGKIDSSWMFEGSFNIKLLDSNRKVIIQSIAKEVTPGSWTQGGKVDFKAVLNYSAKSNPMYLVFEADNPSGLKENAKSYIVIVKSKLTTTPTPVAAKMCGGIANAACPAGYECIIQGKYPDASGKCQLIRK